MTVSAVRLTFLLAFAMVLLPSCDPGTSPDADGVSVDFTLINVSGWRSTAFTIGDTIIVHFGLTNTSDGPLTYHYTGIPVVLKIKSGDSVVATSVDGLLFAQVVLGGVLASGQSMTYDWRGPNTPWNSQSIVLEPGIYHAEADGGVFGRISSSKPVPIQFVVYPGNI